MNRATEIIQQIKEEEKKGLFKRKKEEKKKPESMKSYILELPFHIQNAIKIAGDYSYMQKINRIIVCGVGSGAVSGNLVKNYLSPLKWNIEVVNKHYLPENVDNETLVFVLSYKGDEEEPMLCYRNALRKGCKIVGFIGGGKILESFKRNNVEHILIPQNIPERIAISYMFMGALRYIENSGLIAKQKEIIEECLRSMKKPEYIDMGKHLAEQSKDKSPIVYASSELWAVASSWKYLFNYVSKTHSFWAPYTELAYSELNGFVDKSNNYHVILLRDQDDDKHVVKSINLSKQIVKNSGQSLTELLVKGNNRLSKIFSSLLIGYWTSYYLSELKKSKDKKNFINIYKSEYWNKI